MPKVTATEASRNFSAILDEVEHRGTTYTVERHGRVVARIVPASEPNGAAIRAALQDLPAADERWADDLRDLRAFFFHGRLPQ